MPNPVREMSIGQRFQLGILCEEFSQSIAVAYPQPPTNEGERDAVVANTARIAKYLVSQGINWLQFDEDDKEDYRQAFFAAVLLRHPHDYDHGTLAHDILAAAGLVQHNSVARESGTQPPSQRAHPRHGDRRRRSPRY